MQLAEMIDRISRVPTVDLAESPAVEAAIAESVRYLASDAALRSIDADIYWPKWNSPWWHMLLLWELGLVTRIPERVVRALVDGLNALPVRIFPIYPGELPPGIDPHRETTCHCALGTMDQVLGACGIDVEREMAWAGTLWFVRYQMKDGGLTCDNDAYLVEHECPSSMVGTVAPLEAMLLGDVTGERAAFVDRAAGFLVERRLMLGSSTVYNAEERDRARDWLQPCFPRFYLYDVVRGLRALTRWAEVRHRAIPLSAIEPVVEHLLATSPDGVIRPGRRAYEPMTTRVHDATTDTWVREPASRFPLLEATSVVGAASPALTRQWRDTRASLLGLFEAKLIAGDSGLSLQIGYVME